MALGFSSPSALSSRPVRVLPRPVPPRAWRVVSVLPSRWFRVVLLPSAFRFVCPLWVFRPCMGRVKLPSLPHYIVDPCGSHPVVISGRSCFPSCVCLPVVSSSSLACFRPLPPFRASPRRPPNTRIFSGFFSVVWFVLRPPSKWGLTVNIYCKQYIISKYQSQSLFIKKYQKIFEGFKAFVCRASRCLSCPVSVGVPSYVYAVAVFLLYYAKFKGWNISPLFLVSA